MDERDVSGTGGGSSGSGKPTVVLAHPSQRGLVLVLAMDGTLLSCRLDDIACVLGGDPLCRDG